MGGVEDEIEEDGGPAGRRAVSTDTADSVVLNSVKAELKLEFETVERGGALAIVDTDEFVRAGILSLTLRPGSFAGVAEVEATSRLALPEAIAFRSFFFSLSRSFNASRSRSAIIDGVTVSAGRSRTIGSPVWGPCRLRIEEKCSQSWYLLFERV